MTDPLEFLELPSVRLEPSPEFRLRLMRDLEAEIRSVDAMRAPYPMQQMTLTEAVEDHPEQEGPRQRYVVLLVAAAAVIVALTAVVLVRERSVAPAPLNQQPSTVPFDSVSEGEVAESMLLEPVEYAPGWISVPFKDVVLDRSLAETVPACGPFLDTVFESSQRAAVTSFRSFNWYPPPAVAGQYVVVFPSEDEAQAMFDATIDPRFDEECLQPYQELAAATADSCCDTSGIGTPALFGEPIEYDTEAVGADDVQVRVVEDTFWTDDSGVAHGPEQFREVTLRVGRAIVVMDALMETATGDTVVSVDQFDTAITNAVNQARDALNSR